MELKTIEIKRITPAAYNPRKDLKPGDPEYERLKKSLLKFGYIDPLIWNKRTGNLVGGHQRLKILKEQGSEKCEVIVVDLDSKNEKAANLALNKISGDWDQRKLAEILVEINDGEFDIDVTGFSEADLKKLIDFDGFVGKTDPDEVPEAPKNPVTKAGDLWILGGHRLLCGSGIKEADVRRVLGSHEATMIFTDPPWNVAIGSDSNPKHRQRKGLQNDDLGQGFEAFLKGWCAATLPFLLGDLYCVMGSREWPAIDASLREAGMHWSGTLVWVKDSFVLGRSNYHRRFEAIWYGWPKKLKSSYRGGRAQDDVWEFPRLTVSKEHPTMKPVDLISRAVENSSGRGELVFDPFLGSGTTLLAAEKKGRICAGIEIEPAFCDVIVERWQNFTGKKAKRS